MALGTVRRSGEFKVYAHNEVYPLLNLASSQVRVCNALHRIGQGTNLSEISQRPKPVKSIRQVWELGQVLLEII